MKILNQTKPLMMIICLVIIFLISASPSNSAFAAVELKATSIKRLIPADYRASNFYHGNYDWHIWNKDNTKMMIYESPHDTHPVSRKTGRGLVWGSISDFKSWTNTSDYEMKIRPLPYEIQNGTAQRTDPAAAIWSMYDNDIIYVLRENGWLVKIDTANSMAITNVVQFDVGGIYKNAKIAGWTLDGKLFVMNEEDNWGLGAQEINVLTGNITSSSYDFNVCRTQARRTPLFWAHGHSAISPSGNLYADRCNTTTDEKVCVTDLATCTKLYESNTGGAPNTHFSWKAGEDWWISNSGSSGNYTKPDFYPYYVTQTIYDSVSRTVTHNRLVTHNAVPVRWTDANGTVHYNYGSHFLALLRKDGKQLLYSSTDDGKYTYEDCQYYGSYTCPNGWSSNTWGFESYFLVELSPVYDAQTCTSFTYSAWSECQPDGTQTRVITSSSPAGCTGGNPVLTQSCTYNPAASYTIYKTTISPIIDGNLFEFASASALSFSPVTGGNTVTVKALRNTEALYLGINVTDSQLNASVTSRDGNVWNEDSIEWFIDTLNDGGGSSTPNSEYMLPDDYHGIVNILNAQYDSKGTVSGVPTSTWNGSWQPVVKLNGTINNNTDTDNGYTIEIMIPWTSIGYNTAPPDDTTVRLSFAVNDKDASSLISLMWPNITTAAENASNWQNVILSGSLATIDSIPPAPPIALMVQ